MNDLKAPDDWTARLAALLRADMTPDGRADALRSLGENGGQDTPARQSILHLLTRRLTLLGQDFEPATPAPADAVLKPGDAVPHLRPGGLPGLSLVALSAPGLAEALPNWLACQVAEVVVVDLNGAEGTLLGATDPRLTLLRVGGEISRVQALNLGLRLARHARIVVLTPAIRVLPDYTQRADLPPASFLLEPGTANGAAFVLDLSRDALAASGGFNELLPTLDWAVDDLAARLAGQGLRRIDLPPRLISRIMDERPAPQTASLRESLLADPDFAALQNRILAAALPDWTGVTALPARIVACDTLGQVVQAEGTTPQLPAHLLKQGADQALADLLRQRLGGAPELIPPSGLTMLLARPEKDVWPTDFALACTAHANLVGSRAAWAVVDVDADALPHPGSASSRAFAQFRDLVAAQGQTLVLRGDATQFADLPDLAHLPMIPPHIDTFRFWPMGLRELVRPLEGRPPRHATLAFDSRMVHDIDHLALKGPQILLRRPKIFVDAQHGLGNRLRAIASAGAIAWGTERELVIIWQPDDHCACRFDDLYHPDCGVLTEGFVTEAAHMGMDVYNYMEVEPGSAKGAPVKVDAFRDIYVRSAYPLQNFCSNWHTEYAFIHKLRPTDVVQDLVASVRSPNDLSVHIRAEGGKAVEHLPYEAPENWTPEAHAEIGHWRKRSQLAAFMPRIDALIATGLANRIFAAADTPALYEALSDRYGDRLAWLPRHAADRSTEAIVYALADAILLGRAPRLLGSHWSSFSELAARLSDHPMDVELAGRDF